MTLQEAQSLDQVASWITGLLIAGCLILILFYEFKSREKR